ncbi:hypothetical protein CHUAL_003853 [Chamberlinius hualienensis]
MASHCCPNIPNALSNVLDYYWFWKPKENFDIKEHIRYYSENPMCTKIELNLAVNDIFNWSIPFSRPLWEIILIKCLIPDDILDENVEPKTALVIRAHHAMGDGVSFVRTFFSLMVGKNDDMEMILEKAVSRRKASVKNDFKHKLNIALQRIYMFVFSPAVLIRPLFIQEKHLLHGHKLTGVVITNWSTNIKLETIKAIKNSTSTTVNDVIMTCLAGAIRRYFLRKKTTPPNSVNIYIPVNLQGPNDVLSNKNRLSFVIPKLATGDIDCLTRLKETKFIMDEIKTSPQIMAHQFLFKFSGSVLPNSVIKKIQSFSPCAFILSNLPGPDNKMSLCGCELESVIPMATTRSSTGVGLLVFSYGGKINISTTIDTALITDPSDTSSLLKDIETEVNQLYNCAVKKTQNEIYNNN